jgi:hypothetical protein
LSILADGGGGGGVRYGEMKRRGHDKGFLKVSFFSLCSVPDSTTPTTRVTQECYFHITFKIQYEKLHCYHAGLVSIDLIIIGA